MNVLSVSNLVAHNIPSGLTLQYPEIARESSVISERREYGIIYSRSGRLQKIS